MHAARCSMRCGRVAGRSHTSWKSGADRGGGAGRGGEKKRRGESRRKEKEIEIRGGRLASPMGARSFFRYDRNLRTRPAAGIRTNRTTATPLDFSLVPQPFPGQYATLIRHLRGRWNAPENDVPLEFDMHTGVERDRPSVCPRWHVTSNVTLIAYVICIIRG